MTSPLIQLTQLPATGLPPGSKFKLLAAPDGQLQLLPLEEAPIQTNGHNNFNQTLGLISLGSMTSPTVPSPMQRSESPFREPSDDDPIPSNFVAQDPMVITIISPDGQVQNVPIVPGSQVNFVPIPILDTPDRIATPSVSSSQSLIQLQQLQQLQQQSAQQIQIQMQQPMSPLLSQMSPKQADLFQVLSQLQRDTQKESIEVTSTQEQSFASAALAATRKSRGASQALRGRGRGGGRGGGRIGGFPPRQMDGMEEPEEEAEEVKIHRCTVCGMAYKARSGLRYHMKVRHGTEVPSFTCEFCQKVYSSQRGLAYHLGNCPGAVNHS